MQPVKIRILVIVFFFLFLTPKVFACSEESFKGPWGSKTEKKISNKYKLSINPLLWLVVKYKQFISPVDGDRCSMYPSCSQYSLECLEKHGLSIGWILTCDRLIHEADEIKRAVIIRVQNKNLFYDPVSNNDYRWYENN